MLGVHFAISAEQEREFLGAKKNKVGLLLEDLEESWDDDALDADDYAGALGDEDFAYTWTNLVDLRAFYVRAAAAGRAVLFTAT